MFGMDVSSHMAGPSSYHTSPSMGSEPKDIEVKDLHVYVSKTANANRSRLPAPAIPRKRSDKRDSVRNMPSSGDLKKVKEKTSWLSLTPRGYGGADPWRSAACKLFESEKGTTLHVYLDHNVLYASMYVHALKHTDIRVVHRSLFERKDCLGIYWGTGAICMSPTTPVEPLYIQFPDTETLNLWIVLLRSHAMPEVYGRSHNPYEGGLYRMWRQVELTVMSGRNLGNSKPLDDAGYVDPDETLDMDVYCDIWINGILCGKTAVRKGVGSPDWQESFIFPDLPPFETLEIQVLREKKLSKPVLIGMVIIPLMNVRRGDLIEGSFPVMSPHHSIGIMSGELKLKIRVVEEIILPNSIYSTVERALCAKNTLDWISELDSKLSIKNISSDLVAIALGKNKIVDDIRQLADREVDGSEQSHSTLFRGNTVLTKTLEIFMASEGATFLEASVGRVLRRLCSEKVAIETDPGRSGKSSKYIEKNVDLLVHWCHEIWQSIYDAREKCPIAMRRLFCHIRTLIELRYDIAKDRYSDLPRQGVSAFLFLRFFTPAILRPHMYGFWSGMCDEPVQRSLTLIAKVISSLANLNTATNLSTREEFPRVKAFLTDSLPAMNSYLSFVSSDPSEHPQSPQTSSAAGGRSRLQAHHGVYSKKASLPLLYRESIPELPQMLDISKHFAILTSVVVRYTRLHLPARLGAPSEQEFDVFCQTCLEVEEMALMRVSKMATRSRVGSAKDIHSPTFARSPTTPMGASPGDTRTSSPDKQRRPRKGKRPATAPSDVELLRSQPSYSEMSSTDSPAFSNINMPRMTSNESFASPQHSANSSMAHSLGTLVNEETYLRPSRPLLSHHPRSASTDSALSRKGHALGPPSPSVPVSCLPFSPDMSEEGGPRKKGLLRGFLRK